MHAYIDTFDDFFSFFLFLYYIPVIPPGYRGTDNADRNMQKSPTNLYQFCTLTRLFISGLRAFGTFPFDEYSYACAGNKAGYDAILDKIHDLRNRLFDHLLHFMDQVFQDGRN